MRAATIALVWLGCAACGAGGGTPASGDGAQLADIDAWQLSTPAEDPFGAEEPSSRDCPAQGYGTERGVFEIDTEVCRYATFVQPSLAAVSAGQTVEFSVWHLELVAPEAGRAHVAVQLGDELLWERRVDIPAEPDLWQLAVTAAVDHAMGEPVFFHVHNHGANSWRLSELLAR